VGQDEDELRDKIRTLLMAGTRCVWAVRLTGLRRVEVHEPKVPHYLAYPGQFLEAPGVLRNPVPVEALYDPQAAHKAALRHLLQRRGYADLEAVREEGRDEGELALVLRLLERRIGPVSDPCRTRIGSACGRSAVIGSPPWPRPWRGVEGRRTWGPGSPPRPAEPGGRTAAGRGDLGVPRPLRSG
jgi:hypothetical protein